MVSAQKNDGDLPVVGIALAPAADVKLERKGKKFANTDSFKFQQLKKYEDVKKTI